MLSLVESHGCTSSFSLGRSRSWVHVYFHSRIDQSLLDLKV